MCDLDGLKGVIVVGCNLWYNNINKIVRILCFFGVFTRFCRRWFEASAIWNLLILLMCLMFDVF